MSVDVFNKGLSELQNFPKIVEGSFDCSGNYLSNLKGSPEFIHGRFDCSYNELVTLKGSLKFVKRNFNCHNNKLTTFLYCPKIKGYISTEFNVLISLDYVPENSIILYYNFNF
jgi:hypothetical protein